MKKMLFLAMLLTPTLAFAQTAAPLTATAPAATQQRPVANLGDRKAKILDRLSKRSAELQERQQCVQAAGTNEALDACLKRKSDKK